MVVCTHAASSAATARRAAGVGGRRSHIIFEVVVEPRITPGGALGLLLLRRPMSASRCESSFCCGVYRSGAAAARRPEGCRAHEGTIAAVGMPAWFVA